MSANQTVDPEEIAELIARCKLTLSVSEFHGSLVGYICAGGRFPHNDVLAAIELEPDPAPSADEPSEPSPDLALREPTLDDLLGDAGARVRNAVEKYGRSVTVYRSQAAGRPKMDAGNTMSADDGGDAADAPDLSDATDAGYATQDSDVEAAGAEVMGIAADAEVRSVTDTVTKDGGTGSNGTGSDGTGSEHATATDPDESGRTENRKSASGPSRASKIRAHSRARIRFSRRSRGGTAKSMAEETGQAPGPATSAGSDHSGDG